MKENQKQEDKQNNLEAFDTKKMKPAGNLKWVYIAVLIFVVLSVALIVGILLKHNKEVSGKIEITIDPVVASTQGETHVNGGQRIKFNKIDEKEYYVANIEVDLKYNQYFIYNCKIKNNSSKKLYYDFSFEDEVCQNVTISYEVEGQVETPYTEEVQGLEVEQNQTVILKIYFKITNMDYNAAVRGHYHFCISDKAGELI